MNETSTPNKVSNQEHSEVSSILANERTYAAWLRTGLTAFATALGAQAFLPRVISYIAVDLLTSALTFCSILCFFLAAWRYRHVGNRLKQTSVIGAPIYLLVFCSVMLICVALLTFIGIWASI